MIGSESSVRNEGSGEIRQGKRGDLRSHPEGHGGVVKRLHGAADLGEQVRVRSGRRNAAGDLAVVGVEAAERTKENLPLHAQGASKTDQLGNLLELIAETGSRVQRKWPKRRYA